MRVFGVSTDDVATQAAFAKAQKLNFTLLSDPDGSVAKKYGVLMANRHMAGRKTFVIDPAGTLRHVTDKVDVRNHGAQLAELIRELRGG